MPKKRLITVVPVLAITLCLTAFARVATAAPAVTNTNDHGAGSLREAIAEAAPGETIAVPAGTYSLTSGELTIAKSLTLAGAGAEQTTIRAGGQYRVIRVTGAGNQVTLSGLTVRDGDLRENRALGGGVLNGGAALTLRGVAVVHNSATTPTPAGVNAAAIGGGIASAAATSRLTILDSLVAENAAIAAGLAGGHGGRAIGGGLVAAEGPLTVERATVRDNRVDARGGQGAANISQTGGEAEGGGIAIAVSDAQLTDLTVAGNLADASAGPGAFNGSAIGAGLFFEENDQSAALTRATVTANTARVGRGAAAALAEGGGIFPFFAKGKLAILASTISGNAVEAGENAAAKGGNLVASAQVSVADTIISGGRGQQGNENCTSATGSVLSLGFNLDSLDQCGFHAAGDLTNADPQLGPLQDNGGATATMLPAAGSPAVDHGSAFGLTADQRGLPRPLDFPAIANAAGGDGSDVGAAELQPSGAIRLGGLKLNKRKGTARLAVLVPLPAAGTLRLAGKGVKARSLALDGKHAKVVLVVAAKGAAAKALRAHHKRKLSVRVTYAPTAGSPLTLTKKLKLVRRGR